MALNPDTPFIEFNNSLLLPVLLQERAKEHPDKPALIQNERQQTWSEMVSDINRIANALINMGINPGERVAILGRNSIEYSNLYCGIVTAGGCAVPFSTMLNSESLKSLIIDSEVRAIILTNEFRSLFEPIRNDVPQLEGRLISLDFEEYGWTRYSNWIDSESSKYPSLDIDPDSEFNIIYSSGTTGIPKGIIHSHKIRYGMIGKLYEADFIRVNLVATPLYSNTTIVCWLPTLYAGGINVIMSKFNAEEALNIIEKHKVNVVMFVPVQYDRILQVDNFSDYDLSSLESKYSTSAPLRSQIKKEILERIPGGLTEFYGLTEGGPSATLECHEYPDRLDSVGKPSEVTILKVIDEDGNVLGRNKIGEFVGRNPTMSKGYLNNEEATRAMFWYDQDGSLFYKSGDTGYIDEDGFVYLLDRKKDMIISGGFNIYATDLELALLKHNEVHEVAVIGIDSKEWGETPVAFIVPEKGATISEEDLRFWVNDKLNKFQRISQVIFKDDLPKSPIGKVLKRKLRDDMNKKKK